MSNTLLLGTTDTLDASANLNLTLTVDASNTTLVGTGGAIFVSAAANGIGLYLNLDQQVLVSGNQSFVAGFGADTTSGVANGSITLSNAINTDVQIGNINENWIVVPAGQLSGTFAVPLPVSSSASTAKLDIRAARDRFQTNARNAKRPAARASA